MLAIRDCPDPGLPRTIATADYGSGSSVPETLMAGARSQRSRSPRELPEPFRGALLAWYHQNARDLPWRREPSLYRTVVSEFMLQQTQVKTVLPYFERWMRVFPGFVALASAESETVLRQWEGLGYYSRARNLHKLARHLVDHYGSSVTGGLSQLGSAEGGAGSAQPPAGSAEVSFIARPLPADAATWEGFPGIGSYTAAAITSIHFRAPVAVADGNVVRILARLTGNETLFSDGGRAVKAFRPLAEELLNRNEPGDHNQAMMELGATICFKRKPLCAACPVSGFCVAGRRGDAEMLPRIQRAATQKLVIDRALVNRNGAILLAKGAAADRRLGGLYELPEYRRLFAAAPEGAPLLVRYRGIGNERIEERIHRRADIPDRPDEFTETLHWIPLEQLGSIPLSGPHRKWLTQLLESDPAA